jgi:hypothetical protein
MSDNIKRCSGCETLRDTLADTRDVCEQISRELAAANEKLEESEGVSRVLDGALGKVGEMLKQSENMLEVCRSLRATAESERDKAQAGIAAAKAETAKLRELDGDGDK